MLFLSAFVTISRATTILVLYTPSATYIGSDSEISALDGSEAQFGCKIHVSNDFVWTSAGLLAETSGAFDLRDIAPVALINGKTFEQGVAKLDETLGREFPAFRKRAIDSGVNPQLAKVDIVIADVKEEAQQFSVLSYGADSPTRINCPSDSCRSLAFLALGEQKAVHMILDRRPSIWKQKGISKAMQYLIAAQEHDSPRFVSGPIAVLKIANHRVHWLSRGACH